jgi:hypothetical protein
VRAWRVSCEGGTSRRCLDRLAERPAADDPPGAVAEPRAEIAIGADEPPRTIEARRELDDGVVRVARPDEVRRLLDQEAPRVVWLVDGDQGGRVRLVPPPRLSRIGS